MNMLQELIVSVRGLRKDLGVPEKEAAPITIHAGTSACWRWRMPMRTCWLGWLVCQAVEFAEGAT